MTRTRWITSSALLALAVWVLFTWPLARYLGEGIPMSSQNVEQRHVRAMIPGDHLQLLYHFELVRDMAAGRIPWFHNVYEFNTGSDEERFRPGAYYAPFSLPYALLAGWTGRALAWNIVGALSIWLTALGTILLLARYTNRREAILLGALTAIALPFRWVNLLGGSPAGFAMMWIPWVALGVDSAVRHYRPGGGVLAGAALLLCCWSDLQVFFFAVLSLPLWTLLAFLTRPASRPLRAEAAALLKALLPIAFFLLLAGLYRFARHEQLASSSMAAGRSLAEVRLFSPTWRGFFQWRAEGLQSHVYIGFILPLLLAAGGAGFFGLRRPKSGWRPALVGALLAVAFLVLLIMALGVNGPFHGAPLKGIRALLPPYAMIRQTAKIFCLLPTLAALALAIGWTTWLDRAGARPRCATAWMAVAMILLVMDLRAQIRPTICLLDKEQGAYSAVAEDARTADLVPHVLVLPLWPGDSSWSSLYEYYAQMYGLRMVNGYSPAVRQAYVDEVFRLLESANQGWLTDEQLARLAGMKVRYVLVHENAFPEKVSPFPVALTLQRLEEHPRLQFLARAENVWAFRLEAEPGAREAPSAPACSTAFPARRWEWESAASEGAQVLQDETGGGEAALRLEQPDAWAETRPVRVAPADGLRWLVRGRGRGRLRAYTLLDDQYTPAQVLTFDLNRWSWREVPVTGHDRFRPLRLRLEEPVGPVDVDLALLVSGPWSLASAPDRLDLPPACLFHGGYTAPDGRSVVFRTTHDPESAVLYGPKLPLPAGRYRVRLSASSSAPPGSLLGRMNLRLRENDESGWVDVFAHEPAERLWTPSQDLPLNIVFVYARRHDCVVEKVVIEPLDEAP